MFITNYRVRKSNVMHKSEGGGSVDFQPTTSGQRCRACLSSAETEYSIIDDVVKRGFKFLTNIKVSDSDYLPRTICTECLKNFVNFLDFRAKILKNNKILLETFKGNKLDQSGVEIDKNYPIEDAKQENMTDMQFKEEMMTDIEYLDLNDTECEELNKDESKNQNENVNMIETFKTEINGKPEICIAKRRTSFEIQRNEIKESDADADEEYQIKANKIEKITEPEHIEEKITNVEFLDFNALNDVGLEESDDADSIEENKDIKVRKQIKSKTKIKTEKSVRKPRFYKEVDPNKIEVKKLSKEEQMKRHIEAGENVKYLGMLYKCELCYKGFNYKEKLEAHNETYHKKGSDYRCDICHRTSSNLGSYALHLQRHELLYQCKKCPCCFVDKRIALHHYESKHEGIIKELPCGQCEKVFRHMGTLHSHVRNHHTPTEKLKCGVCSKQFVNKGMLYDHMSIHSEERPHVCKTCGKSFRIRGSLLIHGRTHDATLPYYCVDCDMFFKNKSTYTRHLNTTKRHICPQEIGKYKCELCERGFNTLCSLRTHNARHGPKRTSKPKALPPRNKVCDKCGATFRSLGILIQHLRVHTGERPFECTDCGARFAQHSSFSTHRVLVHGEKRQKKIRLSSAAADAEPRRKKRKIKK